MEIGYSMVFGKTRRHKVKNEKVMNECSLNVAVSDQYKKKSTQKWFGPIKRMNDS